MPTSAAARCARTGLAALFFAVASCGEATAPSAVTSNSDAAANGKRPLNPPAMLSGFAAPSASMSSADVTGIVTYNFADASGGCVWDNGAFVSQGITWPAGLAVCDHALDGGGHALIPAISHGNYSQSTVDTWKVTLPSPASQVAVGYTNYGVTPNILVAYGPTGAEIDRATASTVNGSGTLTVRGDIRSIGFIMHNASIYLYTIKATYGNSAPTVTLPTSVSVAEGTLLPFSASAGDPDGDALTYKWDINNDGVTDSTKTTNALSLKFADNGSYPVKVTVDDGKGATASATATITVTNAAPAIQTINGPTSIAVGGTFSLAATFGDLGLNDGPWIASINWGDNSTGTVSLSAVGAIAATHTYSTYGSYTVSITVRDKDGAASAPRTVAISMADDTPPTISEVVGGTAGLNGWFTGDVIVNWTVTDAESGIATKTGCDNLTHSSNTPAEGITYTCTAKNGAGLSATKSVTVKRDNTAPVVSATVGGTVGADGWYTSDVPVTFTVVDAESGATGDAACATSAIGADTPGTTLTCTATNAAGLSASKSVTIKRDASTPTVSSLVDGPFNAVTGWYTGDVNLSWKVVANGPSGVTGSCAAQSITENTAGATFACTATSGAGKTASSSTTIKRDATVLVVNGSATGPKGANDWFIGDASIDFTVSAAGVSGASTVGCDHAVQSTDTAEQVYTCTATTGAGILTRQRVTVKRDASHPSVTPSPSGSLGTAGWYIGDVSVAWNVAAAGPSGVSPACATEVVSANTAGYDAKCVATSGAGLSSTGSLTVKRDATMPQVTGTPSGTQGLDGWYTSSVVSVGWSVTAAGPSGQTPVCATTQLTADTPTITYSCAVTTGAGRTGSASVTVRHDATAPSLTANVAGTSGNDGWYRSDVTVSWSAADPTSGAPAVPCAASTLTVDNAAATYNCTATNGAGLTTTVQKTVKRDATAPVVSFAGNKGTYTVDQDVSITCSALDPMSGVATSTCANVSGKAYSFAIGTANSYAASATDRAGNTGSASTSFTVGVSDASLCALVQRFSSNAGVATSLCAKLTKGNYDPFRNELAAQAGKKISQADADLLLKLVNILDKQ